MSASLGRYTFALCKHVLCKHPMRLFAVDTRRTPINFKSSITELSQSNPVFDTLPAYLQPFACKSVDDVLNSLMYRTVSNFHSVQLLKMLRVQVLLEKTNLSDIQGNHCFKFLCEVFRINCHKLQPPLLISGLRSLLEIGFHSSDDVIEHAEKAIIHKVDSFRMIDLISCLHLHRKYQHTDLQQVIEKLTEEIFLRIDELSTSSEALMLIQVLHLFNQDQIKIVREGMFDVIGLMNTHELKKAVCYLAKQGSRDKPLLKEVSMYLTLKEDKPDLKETVDILYAMLSLNFLDYRLLSFLTEAREGEIEASEHLSEISSLLTVCGQLKWRHSGLLGACCQWLMCHIDVCTSRELVSAVLTMASLSYVPRDHSVVQKIASLLKIENISSRKIWLDVVWSLVILNHVDKDMLTSIMSANFYKPLLADSVDSQCVGTKLKLMNLMAVFKSVNPECVFASDLFLDVEEFARSEDSENFRKSVLNALGSYMPKETYMATNLNTDMGIHIDAEFIVDESGKPLPLSEYGMKAKPTVVAKDLPPGAKRIALIVWLYKDFTLREKVLTGANVLALRLLGLKGYSVLQVPYEEFSKNSTTIKKVRYLVDHINDAIVKDKNDYTSSRYK